MQCCFVKASMEWEWVWVWVCILGHNVNLIPAMDCGQKVCQTVFHNPGRYVTEIYLGNPLTQKAGKKRKTKKNPHKQTTPEKGEERCSVWGGGGGWSFLRRWVERAA